jgi:hypothetical protein
MAAPTFVDVKVASGGPSWTVTFDATPQDGDFIFLFRGPDWNGELSPLETGFARFPVFGGGGWSAAGNGMDGQWKKASGEADASYTITTSGSPGGCYMTGIVYRGVLGSHAVIMDDMVGGGPDASANALYTNNQTNAAAIPSISTTTADDLHVAMCTATADLGTLTTPSGYTARTNTTSNRIAIYDKVITSPAATGVLTPSGAFTGGGVGVSFYLPAAASVTPLAPPFAIPRHRPNLRRAA